MNIELVIKEKNATLQKFSKVLLKLMKKNR